MLRLILLSMAFSLVACSTAIKMPDSNLCIINAPGQNKKCYNLSQDYDFDGHLKATAKPVYLPVVSVSDLNKNLCVDEDGQANLKAYLKLLREAQTNGQ